MRERVVTAGLALAALAAFYALWLTPSSDFDPEANAARPTSAERRGNGYAGLYNWLSRSGVEVRSFRDRYTALPESNLPASGNLLILSLPGIEVFHSDEFGALDQWVRRGNTLLINAALLDQPGWAAGRSSGTVVEIEGLTSLEFETRAAREARLDETPLSERVRREDARRAREGEDPSDDEEASILDFPKSYEAPGKIPLTATGPHVLLAGVKALALETDFEPDEWSLRMPYDNFVLTLARAANGEGAVFEQRLGDGRILLVAGGSLFTNRALGNDDNARLFSNIVGASVSRDGAVLFDDLRQGLSANYDPARFWKDPRLYRTLLILLGTWFIWVVGSTRMRAPPIVRHDPSEAELVRQSGELIARTVATHLQAARLFDHFFERVARAARGTAGTTAPERAELWSWLERHAAILPQELDRLKNTYAAAHAGRRIQLVPLKQLLDSLEKRLKT
jgi:hypothetical protein